MKEKIREYLSAREISVIRWEGEDQSLVAHIAPEHNAKIEKFKDEMEKDLGVYVALSDMFGMNVIIVESKDIE